jgi:3-hydroxybutyryl-CoA dehydrogenase
MSESEVPDSAVIIGGGTMGAGIAHVLLDGGSAVTVAESSTERAEAATANVRASLEKAAARDKLTGTPESLLQRLSVVDDLSRVPAGVPLVIEAVPERMELKRSVLATVAETCTGAVLASNTSSLSVTELAESLPGQRVLGMHFFNPVPVLKLVELIRHEGVSDEAVERVRGWVAAIGKTAIEVHDTPGFATSRLGLTVGLEAIRMVEDGVATPEDIDTGMTLGYGWPMGPLRLTDLVGLDVRLAIAEHLSAELGERFTPPALLREKVERGELGRKSGRGFFDWDG